MEGRTTTRAGHPFLPRLPRQRWVVEGGLLLQALEPTLGLVKTAGWRCSLPVTTLPSLAELSGVLHQCHVLASEMVHFIHQMQYYITFEVGGPSCDRRLSQLCGVLREEEPGTPRSLTLSFAGAGVLLGRALEPSPAGPGLGPHHRGARGVPGHHHLPLPAGQWLQGKAEWQAQEDSQLLDGAP